MKPARLLGITLLVSLGCTPVSAPTFVDTSQIDRDHVFAIFTDADSAPTRVLGEVGEQSIIDAPRPIETTVTLIGFDDADLAATAAAFSALSEYELRMEIAPPPAKELVVRSEDTKRVTFAIPATADLMSASVETGELTAAAASLLSGLRLVASGPIIPLPQRTMGPFARTIDLVDPGFDIPMVGNREGAFQGFRGFGRVDDERVVLLSGPMVFVVKRGENVDFTSYDPSSPSQYIPGKAMSGGNPLDMKNVAVLPATASSPSRSVLIASEISPPSSPQTGAIFELTLDDSGLRFVGTATITGGPLPMGRVPTLESILVEEDGSVAVVGWDLTVVTREAGASVFASQPNLARAHGSALSDATGDPDDLVFVMHTEDPDAPHLIGMDSGRIIEGNLFTGVFRPPTDLRTLRTTFDRPRITGGTLVRDDAGQPIEIWLSARNGGVARKRWGGTEWELVDPLIPSELNPCARPNDQGHYTIRTNINGVVFGNGFLHLAPQECTAFLTLRLPDLCTGVTRLGDETKIERSDQRLLNVVRSGDTVLLMRDRSRLYGMEL